MFLVGVEKPPQLRPDAEHVEVVAGYFIAPSLLGNALRADTRLAEPVSRHVSEGSVAGAEVQVVRIRLADVLRRLLHNHPHPVGAGNVQGAQDCRVCHAEDHQVRSNRHCQRQTRYQHESRRMAQPPHRNAKIVKNFVHSSPWQARKIRRGKSPFFQCIYAAIPPWALSSPKQGAYSGNLSDLSRRLVHNQKAPSIAGHRCVFAPPLSCWAANPLAQLFRCRLYPNPYTLFPSHNASTPCSGSFLCLSFSARLGRSARAGYGLPESFRRSQRRAAPFRCLSAGELESAADLALHPVPPWLWRARLRGHGRVSDRSAAEHPSPPGALAFCCRHAAGALQPSPLDSSRHDGNGDGRAL